MITFLYYNLNGDLILKLYLIFSVYLCRDEIHRLTEILNSNIASDVERETNQPSLTAEGEAKMKVTFAPEYQMITTEVEKDVNINVLRVSSPRIESNVSVMILVCGIYWLSFGFLFLLYS